MASESVVWKFEYTLLVWLKNKNINRITFLPYTTIIVVVFEVKVDVANFQIFIRRVFLKQGMENVFGMKGILAGNFSNYEFRSGQLEMAAAVEELFAKSDEPDREDAGNVLLVEAETGIGKTLAYLIPAILSGQRIIISTATINLQDQILKKEIPLIENVLGEDIAALCVKGRQNYLCHYRWYQYRSSPQLSLLDDRSCDKIDSWLETTDTGDRAELNWLSDRSPLWPKISSQSNQCLGPDCPEASLCFVNRLRRKAGSAKLLIVNHHLFFSDLALRKEGYGEILPRYEGVVFDEAHHLESVATTFFGRSFGHYQLLDLLGDIERQAQADLRPSSFERLVAVTRGMQLHIERFAALFPKKKGRFHLDELIEKRETWLEEVVALADGIERIRSHLEEQSKHGEGWILLEKRAGDLGRNLLEIGLPETGGDKEYVHWYERRERSITLSATPIRIDSELQQILYPNVSSCVMTSATLTTGGDFAYFRKRLGVDDATRCLHLQSPFDYKERTLLYVPEDRFPEPSEMRYSEAVCERVFEILTLSKGRALLLFTSFKGMDSMAEYLGGKLSYPVFVQGQASRHLLLEKFKEETDSVLLAVASFWEGVDVPGESMSCVIIDKLPFEVPSDPVLQARMADITKSGGKPFFDLQIPRAILSLRQGAGRLMRSSADRGVIAVMDIRLYSKGYGRMFRASMPPSPIVRSLEPVRHFFQKESSTSS